jgi:putative addiction module killer protein
MVEVVSTDEFDKWLRKLKDRVGRLRIVERLDRLAANQPGDAKPVGQGIWELRLTFGPGYRIYYLNDGTRVILLLCGGDKATQQRDIERAHQLAEDYRIEEGQDHG